MELRPNLPNKPPLLQPEMDGQTDTAASPSQTPQHASPHLLGTAVNVPPTPIPSPSRRGGGHLASSAATPSSSLPRSESDTKETGAWAQAECDQQAPQSSRQKAQDDEARRTGPWGGARVFYESIFLQPEGLFGSRTPPQASASPTSATSAPTPPLSLLLAITRGDLTPCALWASPLP